MSQTGLSWNAEQTTRLMLDYSKMNGNIPVVVQDVNSGQILMLAYANRDALDKTIQTGFATFWSRSRNKLWTKGEESGNRLVVKRILADCDQDAVVYLVEMQGEGACHTRYESGKPRVSCFYRRLNTQTGELEFIVEGEASFNDIGAVLQREYNQVMDRIKNPREGSATTKMLERAYGIERKLVEEAWELTAASTANEGRARKISEIADLLYIINAYMIRSVIGWNDVAEEMRKRQK